MSQSTHGESGQLLPVQLMVEPELPDVPSHGSRRSCRSVPVTVLAVLLGLVLGSALLFSTTTEKQQQPKAAVDHSIRSFSPYVDTVARLLWGEQGYVVFRSEPYDAGFGFGDRLSGVFWAAFFALSSKRSLKIDWPEMTGVLVPNKVDWHYNPHDLAISDPDQYILGSRFFTKHNSFPDQVFSGLSSDVLVGNFLDVGSPFDPNDNSWRTFPSYVSDASVNANVMIATANRGGTDAWFQGLRAVGRIPAEIDYWELHHVIFDALFRVHPTFWNEAMVMKVGSSGQIMDREMSLNSSVGILGSPGVWSLAVHIRNGDWMIQNEAKMGTSVSACQAIDKGIDWNERLQCIKSMAGPHMTQPQRILVIFSDSECVKRHLQQYFTTSSEFTEVWTQELSGGVNIDRKFVGNAGQTANHAFRQAMRDWLLMRATKSFAITTAYPYVSGFPATAAATAANRQTHDLKTCQLVDKQRLCARRLC